MKVALVLPPAERIAEKKDTPTHQHIGLGYLAAVLQKNGIEVKIIDAKLERINFNQTVEAILNSQANIVGITAMTHEINTAGRLARHVKKIASNVFTVIGGVHVTALPVETLKCYASFDAGILEEGEKSFIDILKLIERKDFDFSDLKGIVYRAGKDVLLSRPAESIEDLDELPFPAWSMFPRATEYIMITSRGCPFSCIFCMRALGQKIRKRSAENVVDEIESVLKQRKPQRFLFYDETFTVDKKHVYEVCELLINKGLNKHIRWSATTRVDSVNRDLLARMKEAGCDHIEFGVESGSEEVLKKIKKGITKEQAREAFKTAKELGFYSEAAFILGHPDETLPSAYETIHFASELNADIVQLGIMVPYPGTEVADMAQRGMGGYRIISDNWSDYNKQLGSALELENLSRQDLERIQLAGYLKLFIFNRRYKDLIRFIWNFRREMIAFLKNHFKKNKSGRRTSVNFLLTLKMIFKKSAKGDF